jgi:hypothetical protein
MSQYSDVLDILCDDSEPDSYGCAIEIAQEALNKFQTRESVRIDDLSEEEFDADEIAEKVYSTSEFWE